MKLQAKFTLYFVLMVITTLMVSFYLIHWSFEVQFDRLIQEKNQQWRERMREDRSIVDNPFDPIIGVPRNRQTPENRFLSTVSSSLLIAAIIDILLAVIVAHFLSKFLLQRIYKLKSSMHDYMEDSVTKPVLHNAVDGVDEVDELARIYNLLIEKIEKEKKVRNDFFIDMSHELRTPLTAIKGYLDGLIDKVFDPEKEQNIQKKTLDETNRMIRLVKEMTTLAKLEIGDIQLSKESTDIGALTNEVVETFLQETQKRHIKIEIHGSIQAEVDPYKFRQVIINLLDNALDYGKNGEIIVIAMGEENGRVYWRIQNAVEGVNPKDLEYFFERFYRADKSRSYDAKKPHLGIGLNIVKKIIEQHGGTIEAQMEEDKIIFDILLPYPISYDNNTPPSTTT